STSSGREPTWSRTARSPTMAAGASAAGDSIAPDAGRLPHRPGAQLEQPAGGGGGLEPGAGDTKTVIQVNACSLISMRTAEPGSDSARPCPIPATAWTITITDIAGRRRNPAATGLGACRSNPA